MRQLYALFVFLLIIHTPQAQVTLSADGPGNTYALIESKGFGIESPDCRHTSFGPHVTEVFDNTLGKNVFVFHSHPVEDDDRCGADDRVRMEIKGGSGSPAAMQHTEGQTAYYRWKFKLDAGFIPSSRFTHIFQIKAIEGDAGAPLITITPRAGNPQKMQIIHSAGEGSGSLGTVHQVDLAPFKGTWVEAYVKYKSSEGSAGTFEITIKRISDGVTLLSYSRTGIDMWRTDADYNRPKWGVYRGKDDVLRDEQVRFADFCISETSEGQCPSSIGSNPPGGGTVTLTPTHDAYVRNGTNAGTTHGTTDPNILITKLNATASAGNDRHTYLKFDASSAGSTITAAVLRLYGKIDDSRSSNVPISAYAVSNTTWTESTITWNNKPATGSSLQTATVTDATARYYTWDITNYVQSEIAAGRTVISLALLSGVATDPRITWNSKETGSNPPQLVITTPAALQSQQRLSQAQAEEEAKGMTLMAWPNPFRQSNTITFQLAAESYTHLAAYDITGKQVAVLANGRLAAGIHRAYIKPGAMQAGIYLLRLVSNGQTVTRKLVKE